MVVVMVEVVVVGEADRYSCIINSEYLKVMLMV